MYIPHTCTHIYTCIHTYHIYITHTHQLAKLLDVVTLTLLPELFFLVSLVIRHEYLVMAASLRRVKMIKEQIFGPYM